MSQHEAVSEVTARITDRVASVNGQPVSVPEHSDAHRAVVQFIAEHVAAPAGGPVRVRATDDISTRTLQVDPHGAVRVLPDEAPAIGQDQVSGREPDTPTRTMFGQESPAEDEVPAPSNCPVGSIADWVGPAVENGEQPASGRAVPAKSPRAEDDASPIPSSAGATVVNGHGDGVVPPTPALHPASKPPAVRPRLLRRGRVQRATPATSNPLLAGATTTTATARELPPEAPEDDVLLGSRLVQHGPVAPLGTAAARDDQPFPRFFARPTGCIQVVGLHGGSGASTVATLLGEATDCGTRVPTGSQPVVLMVARTHGAGLAQVARAGRLWSSGQLADIRLVGLVLVDDGPRLTRDQQRAAKQVLRVLPHTWRLGWMEPWRSQVTPETGSLPVRIRRSLNGIREQARPFLMPDSGSNNKE